MKILILGANGMLGFALFNYLNSKKNLKVFGTIRKKVSKQKANHLLMHRQLKKRQQENFQ